jgi:hypothetical protein
MDPLVEQEGNDPRRWLTEVEARKETQRGRTSLWKLRCDGTLIAERDGPYLIYDKGSVDAYLKQRRRGGSR